MTEDVERILTAMDDSPARCQSLAEVRDRALILLTSTSAVRASKLAVLNFEDLEPRRRRTQRPITAWLSATS